MIFSYEVVTYKSIDVNLQDLFDYAVKELQKDLDTLTAMELNYYVLDNIDYILKEIYPCHDLDVKLNDYQLEELSDAWENWLSDKVVDYNFDKLVKDLL